MYIRLCTQESQLAPLATKNTVSGHSHCTASMENRAGGSGIFGLETKPLQDGCDTGGKAWVFIA